MPSYLGDNDKFKEDLVKALTEKMPNVQQSVLDGIFKVMDNISSAGGYFDVNALTGNEFMQFVQVIRQSLNATGYAKDVEVFISNFGKITLNTSKILKHVGGYDIPPVQLSQIEQKWKMLTSETLINSGIRKDFEQPILQILDEAISYGGSISAAKKKLTDFIAGGNDTEGRLKSYVLQTSRDSIKALQGQQFHSVANNIETAGVRYIGSILGDSRGQCTRWVRELKGFIPWEDLQSEIKLAEKYIKEKRVDVINGKRHPWSGLMKDTKPENFLSKLGGYNCTHTGVPVRKKPK